MRIALLFASISIMPAVFGWLTGRLPKGAWQTVLFFLLLFAPPVCSFAFLAAVTNGAAWSIPLEYLQFVAFLAIIWIFFFIVSFSMRSKLAGK